MKNRYTKILSLLIALLMAFSMVACTDTPPSEIPVDPDNGSGNTQPEQTELAITPAFVIIRPDDKVAEEVEAVQLLKRALTSLYGSKFEIQTDWRKDDESVNEFEILVGKTNRKESQELYNELGNRDWTYRVVNPNVIVIGGDEFGGTLEATRAFLRDMFGYEENEETGEVVSAGSAKVLEIGLRYDYHYQPPITSMTLGAHELSAYTIVTAPKIGSVEAAQTIADHLEDLTGIELPVVALNTYKNGNGGPAIFFGCANAEANHLKEGKYGKDRYYITEDGDNIIIDFLNTTTAQGAANRFVKECTPKDKESTTFNVSFREQNSITAYDIPVGTNKLELESKTVIEVAPGVTYEERLYRDENGKPVRAYLMTVAKGAATVATCLPGDKATIGTYGTILEQVSAAKANGKKVVAGINADFFEGTMLGLCVRDGALLHTADGRPWFGVKKDGTPVIGNASEYDKNSADLWTAVGGSNIIIEYDQVSHVSVDHEFGYTRHPRTAVGYKEDGSIVLLVVDGRQPEISNGASLADLADILGSMECVKALNLDGGGSSTFVLAEDGELNVKNSPSDGKLRDVADGLMVILP